MPRRDSTLPFWRAWNTTEAEQSKPLPCDDLIPEPQDVLHRAIDVNAPVEFLFVRLCQMRVAPYSYDILDNFGKKSPAEATVAASDLAIGDPIMTIFSLQALEVDRQMTISMTHPKGLAVFGALAITYRTWALSAERSRLVIRMLMSYPPRYPARITKHVLRFGDWFMCQKQVRTFKKYAEADFELTTTERSLT